MELAVLEEGQVSRGAGEVEALLPAGPVLVASSAVRRKKPCCRAPRGLMRAAGSYSSMRSTRSFLSSFVLRRVQPPPGSRSKYLRALGACSSIGAGGMPNTSTIRLIWSTSLEPLKRGSPVCISTRMQPRDHMSMARS